MSDEKIGGGKRNPTPDYNNAVRARGDQFNNALTAYGHTGPAVATQLGGPLTTSDGAAQIALNEIKAKAMLARLTNHLAEQQSGAGRRLTEINAAMQGDRARSQYDNNVAYLKAEEEIANDEPWYEKMAGIASTITGAHTILRGVGHLAGDPETNSYDEKTYKSVYDELYDSYTEGGMEVDKDTDKWMHETALEAARPKGNSRTLKAVSAPAKILEGVFPGLRRARNEAVALSKSQKLVQERRMTRGQADAVRQSWLNFYSSQKDLWGNPVLPDEQTSRLYDLFMGDLAVIFGGLQIGLIEEWGK